MTKNKDYFLGKVQGFLEAFNTLSSDGNESSGGMFFALPDAGSREAACWKLVRSECSPNWHQKLRVLELVPADENWRKQLADELVGETLPGGYLLQLMYYRGDDQGRDVIVRVFFRLLEDLFGDTPLRVWRAGWRDIKGDVASPWAWISASEWVFEAHTGNFMLVLAHDS